ncbi:hypothetical protein CHS0354_002499 [Potamilus streckersoni]|uniref:Proteasomal ATPase-associated factor 1 n=1 Tax=Potamilus streckersoni TaxID=2493646 RepID=A0AAE0SRJ2_9BIVA|nr:hypothetical protein CHS0354_002499 [Potamilus streckersoni]
MAALGERIILQSDWDQVLKDDEGKVWLSYKVTGRPTVHGELQTRGLSTEGYPYVMGSNGFSVLEVNKQKIKVTYSKDAACCTRKFIAADTTFSSVHKPRKSIHSLDVTPGGLGVSSDSEGKLKIWQTENGEVRRNLEGHYGDVYSCKFFPTGIVVLSAGSDMQVKIWSAETGHCAATLIGHKGAILDTAIVDRGRNIVTCGRDGTARLWDVGQQSCLGIFSECGGDVNSCCLAHTSKDVDLGNPDSPPSDREISTEGKLLLLGCENGTLKGYGLQSRKKVFELPCHSAVNCCCFLSEVSVVCGTQDGHITVTDIRNYRLPLKEWKENRSAVLSLLPIVGGFFASTGDGSCFFVDGNFQTTTEFTGSDCDHLYKIAIDGTNLYTACRDGQIRKYRLNLL